MNLWSNLWWLMVVAGVGTFAIRYSFIGMTRSAEVNPWAARLLANVPAAAMAALTVSSVVYGGVHPGLVAENARLPAALLAGLVAWRTRSVTATILCGMAALWAVQWVYATFSLP
jgi:branched-subunit amino acid transport protein